MNLDGQVAIVTGGAAGIGRAVVDAYLQAGARVGVLDRSAEGLERLTAEIGTDRVIAVEGDVTSAVANHEVVGEVIRSFGRLDILVGNAGIGDRALSLVELSDDQFDRAFDDIFHINVKGYLLAARAAYPALLKTSGTMIFTASYSSFGPAGGGPLYVASKHAVAGLVRQLAYELAPDIRVNAVAPGLAETALGGIPSLDQRPASALLPGIEEHLPLGFVPAPEDHAQAYVFLASREAARAMTGAFISTDSGLQVRGITQTRGTV